MPDLYDVVTLRHDAIQGDEIAKAGERGTIVYEYPLGGVYEMEFINPPRVITVLACQLLSSPVRRDIVLDMTERVASAILAKMGEQFGRTVFESESVQRNAREVARSAIEAMRDPTEAMIEASNREWDGRMSHRSSGAWRAMIDAALYNNG